MTTAIESNSCCPCDFVCDWASAFLDCAWQCYRAAVRCFCEMLYNCGLEFVALTLSTWLTEPCATLYAAIWYPLGFAEDFNHHDLNPTEITAERANRIAIVLIHGRYSNPSNFLDLAKELKEHGIGPVYTVKTHHYEVTDADVKIVQKLFEKVEKQYAKWGKKPTFDLVGHSRGAWVATKTLKADPRVGRVFRLANPTLRHELEDLTDEQQERIHDIPAADDIIFLEESALPSHRVHHVPSGHVGAVHHSSSMTHLCQNLRTL